jgi:hypothetical protein
VGPAVGAVDGHLTGATERVAGVSPVRLTRRVMRMRLQFFWPSRRVCEFDEFCLLAA